MNVTEIYDVLPHSELREPEEIDCAIKIIEKSKRHIILAATGEFTPDDPDIAMEPLKGLTILQDKLKRLKEDIEEFKSKNSTKNTIQSPD